MPQQPDRCGPEAGYGASDEERERALGGAEAEDSPEGSERKASTSTEGEDEGQKRDTPEADPNFPAEGDQWE